MLNARSTLAKCWPFVEPYRRMAIASVTVGCIMYGSVAAAQAGDTPNSQAKRLSHAELVDLLAGGVRFRALPIRAGYGTPGREYFRTTGEYEGCGLELEIFGKFAVKRNAICVATGAVTHCREILQLPTGEYLERLGGTRNPLKVEISKSNTESCRTVGVSP